MRPGEGLFNAKVAICSRFGLTFTEADNLKAWQMNKLLSHLEEEDKKEGASGNRSGRPAGAIPVMT